MGTSRGDAQAKKDDFKQVWEKTGAQGVASCAVYSGTDPQLTSFAASNPNNFVILKKARLLDETGRDADDAKRMNRGAIAAFTQEESLVRQLPASPYIARGLIVSMEGEKQIASEIVSYTLDAGKKGVEAKASDSRSFFDGFTANADLNPHTKKEFVAFEQGLGRMLLGFSDSIHQAQRSMHQAGLLHLDTALRNFMVSHPEIGDDGQIKFSLKMIDFGQSREMTQQGVVQIPFAADEVMSYPYADKRAIIGEEYQDYEIKPLTDDVKHQPGELYIRMKEGGGIEYQVYNADKDVVIANNLGPKTLARMFEKQGVTISEPLDMEQLQKIASRLQKLITEKGDIPFAKTRIFSIHTDLFAKKCTLIEMIGASVGKSMAQSLFDDRAVTSGTYDSIFRRMLSDPEALNMLLERQEKFFLAQQKEYKDFSPDPRTAIVLTFINSFRDYLTSMPDTGLTKDEVMQQDDMLFQRAMKNFQQAMLQQQLESGITLKFEDTLRVIMSNSDLLPENKQLLHVNPSVEATEEKQASSPDVESVSDAGPYEDVAESYRQQSDEDEAASYNPAMDEDDIVTSYNPSADEEDAGDSYNREVESDADTDTEDELSLEKSGDGYFANVEEESDKLTSSQKSQDVFADIKEEIAKLNERIDQGKDNKDEIDACIVKARELSQAIGDIQGHKEEGKKILGDLKQSLATLKTHFDAVREKEMRKEVLAELGPGISPPRSSK